MTRIRKTWRIGEYTSRQLESAAWGEGGVEQLHNDDEKVAPLVRQLLWTHNLLAVDTPRDTACKLYNPEAEKPAAQTYVADSSGCSRTDA